MNFIRLMTASILFYAGHVCSESTAGFPQSLLYKNKPINARCFTGDDNHPSLKQCNDPDKTIQILGQNKILVKQGFTGYVFKYKDDEGSIEAYSYYQPIAHFDNTDVIYTINSGGGSGEFTAIKTVVRDGSHLKVQTYSAGDRCNNGISDVKQNKDNITYHVYITPFDFLALAKDNPHHLKAYDDLVACAACCAGTLKVSRPLNKHFYKATYETVDFSHYTGFEAEKSYQNCFNELIMSYKNRNHTRLSMSELEQLVRQFNKQCVSNKK